MHTKAYLNEARAYISDQNPAILPYSRSQIVRAEQRLGLWQTVGSTSSSEADRPTNLEKCKDHWEEPCPFGVNAQDTASMIDIDEAGFKIDNQDKKRGKVTKQRRAKSKGKYKKG